ncbi:hypothetical protein DV711_11405 [Motiliproteus coralliicola]|uniref:Uncharacterized protein n=1 Tax=Motiliproteus coralliicola TaxID=2283196 RepID=A0A369WDU4_9GAMM|nr:DUF6482 family protein [Motiliproteus coralliicola]RDE19491.1 hypothetical protein DV711_11405 [Motiliproteus coralliicola]
MKLHLSDLQALQPIHKVVIHAFEQMTYQVSVTQNDQVSLLYYGDTPYCSRSLTEIRELMESLQVEQYVLRHDGVYEEMIGMPNPTGDSALEIPLGWHSRAH